ncbi:transmembrane protein 94 isoform X1 [Clarias magur]|uniref:Transmembrane protein 94 isoform X1 n=1 Tax=Clarias magur TaxID=1594786 RepID=A0A8J4WWV9_CLAMG|nr:transmembrane protein 94 isoform X1 [Clarias magur]
MREKEEEWEPEVEEGGTRRRRGKKKEKNEEEEKEMEVAMVTEQESGSESGMLPVLDELKFLLGYIIHQTTDTKRTCPKTYHHHKTHVRPENPCVELFSENVKADDELRPSKTHPMQKPRPSGRSGIRRLSPSPTVN